MQEMIDWQRLQDFFAAEDIEWKPIAIAKASGKGLAAAYVTNRAIMDRLDQVCGPANWKNEYKAGPDGGVLCGIAIRVPRSDGAGDEWIAKWDGAENTDIEPVKGGLSSSMRRAAVQWGIGRYLYNLPGQWVPVDERGRFVQTPSMPPAFLPRRDARPAARPEAPARAETPRPANGERREAPGGPRRAPQGRPGAPSEMR